MPFFVLTDPGLQNDFRAEHLVQSDDLGMHVLQLILFGGQVVGEDSRLAGPVLSACPA